MNRKGYLTIDCLVSRISRCAVLIPEVQVMVRPALVGFFSFTPRL